MTKEQKLKKQASNKVIEHIVKMKNDVNNNMIRNRNNIKSLQKQLKDLHDKQFELKRCLVDFTEIENKLKKLNK